MNGRFLPRLIASFAATSSSQAEGETRHGFFPRGNQEVRLIHVSSSILFQLSPIREQATRESRFGRHGMRNYPMSWFETKPFQLPKVVRSQLWQPMKARVVVRTAATLRYGNTRYFCVLAHNICRPRRPTSSLQICLPMSTSTLLGCSLPALAPSVPYVTRCFGY